MQVYERASCSVCGGSGIAYAGDAWAAWVGGLRHRNPRDCAVILRERAQELDRREAKLREGA